MNAFITYRVPPLFFACALVSALSAQKSVLTQHNDVSRTGWYSTENILNKSNVNARSFGKIFTRTVDDQVYAQPLVKMGVSLPGFGTRNVVFVATVNNTLYAFDADSANVSSPYWQVNLTAPHSRAINHTDETGACSGAYNDFSGNMGIVGTPVIDSATNTLYVVARSIDSSGSTTTAKQFLHALNITNGQEKANSPVLITATVNGTGDGSSNGQVVFDGLRQNQRSGLLLLNGVVYIAWSSHCDWGPYHGWLIGYDETSLQQKYIYNSTPDGYNGGIWMSGGGPSADSSGNIYIAVGNGSVGNGNPADLRNRSESALKLSPSGSGFTIQSFFTPKNYEILEGADLDFGVTQLMLIPGTKRAIVGVKDGHMYLMDRDNMGGYSSVTDNAAQTIDLGSNSFLRSSMSYFQGRRKNIYSWSENSLLRAFSYDTVSNLLNLDSTIISGLQGPTGNSGAVLSVSSNGSTDSTAILWASYAANGDANQSVRPGILRAIDASDVTKELWNSSINPNDYPGNYAKFNCPTIANGKVYLGTFSNQLTVYGLAAIAPDTCNSANVALNRPTYVSSVEGSSTPASYATDGNLNTRWSSQFSDPQYIFVDLGAVYDLCKVVLHWETALGKDFKIQVSNDSATWTDVVSITDNTLADNSIPVKASGRYVRLYGTQRGTGYGYSLWEFEVYGKPSPNGCPPPDSLHTSDVYQTTATLHWSAPGLTNFLVQYKTVAAVNWNQATAISNVVTINNLSCNTPYLYRVQAICTTADSSAFPASGGFTTLDCNVNCDPLPTRWSTQDIGNTGVAGSACYNSTTGTFELTGSGADIGGTQDAFRFAYKTIVGDGEITARITDIDNVSSDNKCGIMVRESLAEGSRYAFICLTNSDGAMFQTRTTTDGAATNSRQPGISAPNWLKLIITGSTYTGYISSDGLNWRQAGSPVVAGFGNGLPVYGGLALTSHDNTTASTAHIDNLNMGGVSQLKLISFTGSLSLNQTVALQWTTTLETRTNYFVVERTKDFMNYVPIDTVQALDNGEFTQNYDAVDIHPLRGINYYRLRIVDLNGSITYSPVVAVRVTNDKAPLMYPNPANTFINIAPGTDVIKYINVYNILGKTVFKMVNSAGQGIFRIPTYALANGVYFLEIRTTNAIYREKMVVQN